MGADLADGAMTPEGGRDEALRQGVVVRCSERSRTVPIEQAVSRALVHQTLPAPVLVLSVHLSASNDNPGTSPWRRLPVRCLLPSTILVLQAALGELIKVAMRAGFEVDLLGDIARRPSRRPRRKGVLNLKSQTLPRAVVGCLRIRAAALDPLATAFPVDLSG